MNIALFLCSLGSHFSHLVLERPEWGNDLFLSLTGFRLIRLKRFALTWILCDSRMPELEGMGVLQYLKEHASDTPFILLTAYGSVENVVEFMKMGAADYLQKPLQNPDELRLLVAKVLNDKSLQNQNELLKQENQIAFPCSSIVSRNAAMLRVLQMASPMRYALRANASYREKALYKWTLHIVGQQLSTMPSTGQGEAAKDAECTEDRALRRQRGVCFSRSIISESGRALPPSL